jgi:hypothetical protein
VYFDDTIQAVRAAAMQKTSAWYQALEVFFDRVQFNCSPR